MIPAAAREEAEKFLNRTLHDETVPDQDTTGLVITPLIKLRLMQLVGYCGTRTGKCRMLYLIFSIPDSE